MREALITPAEMAEIDRHAIAAGPFSGLHLMENAGRAVYREILARFPDAVHFAVLCGPGNNGGDGYVIARLLAETGLDVSVHALGESRDGTDAAVAAARCGLDVKTIEEFAPREGWLVVDALFGAGLSRSLPEPVRRAARLCEAAGVRVVAVDVPSGLDGASGRIDDGAFAADLTVTFVRRKPGHLLEPGRSACGAFVLADIGIGDAVVEAVRATAFENRPGLWSEFLPLPARDTHKYRRGHCAVFAGPAAATGAARLAALSAARAGAGAVTLIARPDAVAENATHLTAIMVRESRGVVDALAFMAERKVTSFVIGPGLGRADGAAADVLQLLEHAPREVAAVLDADGISVLQGRRDDLAAAMAASRRPLVLTPHEGEFARLFPDLATDETLSKLDRARRAAALVGGVVIIKGPDTVVASPDGRAAINANGSPFLATAGSGDVLAGLVAGLLAQGMPAWEAGCAAVWIHAEAGTLEGAGLTADDLPNALVPVLKALLAS